MLGVQGSAFDIFLSPVKPWSRLPVSNPTNSHISTCGISNAKQSSPVRPILWQPKHPMEGFKPSRKPALRWAFANLHSLSSILYLYFPMFPQDCDPVPILIPFQHDSRSALGDLRPFSRETRSGPGHASGFLRRIQFCPTTHLAERDQLDLACDH